MIFDIFFPFITTPYSWWKNRNRGLYSPLLRDGAIGAVSGALIWGLFVLLAGMSVGSFGAILSFGLAADILLVTAVMIGSAWAGRAIGFTVGIWRVYDHHKPKNWVRTTIEFAFIGAHATFKDFHYHIIRNTKEGLNTCDWFTQDFLDNVPTPTSTATKCMLVQTIIGTIITRPSWDSHINQHYFVTHIKRMMLALQTLHALGLYTEENIQSIARNGVGDDKTPQYQRVSALIEFAELMEGLTIDTKIKKEIFDRIMVMEKVGHAGYLAKNLKNKFTPPLTPKQKIECFAFWTVASDPQTFQDMINALSDSQTLLSYENMLAIHEWNHTFERTSLPDAMMRFALFLSHFRKLGKLRNWELTPQQEKIYFDWIIKNNTTAIASSIGDFFAHLTHNDITDLPSDCLEMIIKVDPEKFNFWHAASIIRKLHDTGLLSSSDASGNTSRANFENLFRYPEFWKEIEDNFNDYIISADNPYVNEQDRLIKRQQQYDVLLQHIYERPARQQVTEALNEGALLLPPLLDLVCKYVTFGIENAPAPEKQVAPPQLELTTETKQEPHSAYNPDLDAQTLDDDELRLAASKLQTVAKSAAPISSSLQPKQPVPITPAPERKAEPEGPTPTHTQPTLGPGALIVEIGSAPYLAQPVIPASKEISQPPFKSVTDPQHS